MSSLAALCVTAVIVWAACVAIAHLVNPGQDPLAMGMSGLARGEHGWLMRAAFVARGASALLLVAVLVLEAPADAWSRGGMALLWAWGLGSALLAVYATDMPGETPTEAGRVHAVVAAVTYVCVVAGALWVSTALRHAEATAGLVTWALPLAILAGLAMVGQFAAFAVAARPADGGLGRYAGLLQRVFVSLVMLWTALVAAAV